MKAIDVDPVAPTTLSMVAKDFTVIASRSDASNMQHVISLKVLESNSLAVIFGEPSSINSSVGVGETVAINGLCSPVGRGFLGAITPVPLCTFLLELREAKCS